LACVRTVRKSTSHCRISKKTKSPGKSTSHCRISKKTKSPGKSISHRRISKKTNKGRGKPKKKLIRKKPKSKGPPPKAPQQNSYQLQCTYIYQGEEYYGVRQLPMGMSRAERLIGTGEVKKIEQ